MGTTLGSDNVTSTYITSTLTTNYMMTTTSSSSASSTTTAVSATSTACAGGMGDVVAVYPLVDLNLTDLQLTPTFDINTFSLENCGLRIDISAQTPLQQHVAGGGVGVLDAKNKTLLPAITLNDTVHVALSNWALLWTVQFAPIASTVSFQVEITNGTGDEQYVSYTHPGNTMWYYSEEIVGSNMSLEAGRTLDIKSTNATQPILLTQISLKLAPAPTMATQTSTPASAATVAPVTYANNFIEFMQTNTAVFWVIVGLVICCVLVSLFGTLAYCFIKRTARQTDDYSMRDADALDY